MNTKTYFAFRVDVWDSAANSIVEHIAGIDDFEVAVATYRAAVARWPAARITLRQGARGVPRSSLVVQSTILFCFSRLANFRHQEALKI